MPRTRFSALLTFAVVALTAATFLTATSTAHSDVSGVYSDVPVFQPGQLVRITVTAEDDDGTLRIRSSLEDADLTVLLCTGVGPDQVHGECDGSDMEGVRGQDSDSVRIDTDELDDDDESEPLTVLLTLLVNCDEEVAVTVSADQPGNVGPDDVTINCLPIEATPTSTPPPTITPLPELTNTPLPQPTLIPQTPLISEVNVFNIQPPNTGSAGLAR